MHAETEIPSGGPVPRPCDLLISNGHVITMDAQRRIYRRGAIAIDGPLIVAVGPDEDLRASYVPARVLDAEGAPVHPGLIDCHVHATLQTTRGLLPDVRPERYFRYYAEWFDALDAEDEHAATLLASFDMLRHGVTFFLEPGTIFDTDAAAAAVERVGIRASFAEPFLWDVADQSTYPAAIGRAPATRSRALSLVGRELWRNRSPDALVRGHVAVQGAGSASDELEILAKTCADENSTFLTRHQSFKPSDASDDDRRFGRHPLLHYSDLGVLGPNCLLVHMNMIRDDEVAPIVESGVSVCWCPAPAMNWGAGAAFRGRMGELNRLRVNIALGSDTPKYGYGTQGFVAYLIERDKHADPITVEDAFEMSTIGGARAAGVAERLGSLVPGMNADIVIHDHSAPEVQPGYNIVNNLVLVSRGSSVRTVVVNGRIVLENGSSSLVDGEEVRELASASARRMIRRLDLKPDGRWPVLA